jgi:hypothetical protein
MLRISPVVLKHDESPVVDSGFAPWSEFTGNVRIGWAIGAFVDRLEHSFGQHMKMNGQAAPKQLQTARVCDGASLALFT